MPYNGSGVYAAPASSWNPAVAATTIDATAWNTLRTDLSTGLSTCVLKDGTQTVTANLPLAGFKLTGVGAATARTDAATLATIQDTTGVFVAGGGTVDVITATFSPAITAVVDGMLLGVRATGANATTTPTFSPNGLTARTIVKQGGQALLAGDIRAANHDLLLRYRATGTVWELINPTIAPAAVTTADFASQIYIGFTTGGTSTAYTLTPSPAIAAYTARTLFSVTFHVASGAAPTLAISGVATPPNLVRQVSAGTYANIAANDIPINHVSDVVLLSASQALVRDMPPAAAVAAPFIDSTAIIKGSADATKLLAIEVDGFTTGTTRTITPPDRNISLGTTLGTEQASTAGASIDFTGIPSGARVICIMLIGVSTNGTANLLIQIGDSGGIEITGYTGLAATGAGAGNVTSTAGFIATASMVAADVMQGSILLYMEDSSDNTWVSRQQITTSNQITGQGAGSKALSDVLDRVRITTVGGTDTFDLGVINISYGF